MVPPNPHPAESAAWKYAMIGTFLAFVFFTFVGEGKVLFVLRFAALGLFIAAVTGAVVAEVLLKHAYWVEEREHRVDQLRQSRG
ncbi:hypothetical protein Rhe02_39380 [Rhizocola hellebori]|uniref:Uncharacterized protein n=1 Tax=Rhizocola hellebori TaxID=1392758 RepID=A0A8J3QA17_9ACTN|nr:hypothetical protein [Rhizocola hellebori]GIH05871.1 hypothetical protein Rhe02_39380 [Rhizocola hellebori]